MAGGDENKGEGGAKGYGLGSVDTVISVEAVTEEAAKIAQTVTTEDIMGLAGGDPYLILENLNAGYGRMEILHNINLAVARKQSLCLI